MDIFDGLTGLEFLDLSCNYFTTLDFDIFDPLATSLTNLNLRSDSFTPPLDPTAIRAKFSAAGFDVRTGTRTCARVTASPTSLTVAEGSTGMYSVALRSLPPAIVTVDVTSDNTDVTVSPTSLTFSTSNWDTAQTVTVSAAQDADGADEPATLILDPSGSGSGDYEDRVISSALTVIVTDDDEPGVTVTPTSLMIDEGSTGTYTVELTTQPSGGNVTVAIGSDNPDVTSSSTMLTFTTSNWNSAQTVTVTAGQDADAADDTAVLTLDPDGADYASVSDATVTVTVTDYETAGLTVTPTSLTVGEGSTGTYTVKLNTQPSGGNVTVAISSDNGDVTTSSTSLTFTSSNWSAEQTVTVTAGQDADAADDTAALTHDPSGGGYGSVSDVDVTVTVTDDETRGVTVSESSLTIEEGDSGMYTVVLLSEPTATVTIGVSDDSSGVSVSPSNLTFTTSTWSAAQTVTVTSTEDDVDEADQTATVMHDVSGGDYGSETADDVTVTVTDDDTRGVTVSESSLTIEEGDSDTYTVVLMSAPTGNVTIGVSSDIASVTVSSSSLTFTAGNWNTARTITVSSMEDRIDEADQTATVTHMVSGGDYGSVSATGVTVTVTDDDTPGVTTSPTSLTIAEGGSSTYTVALNTQPSGDVTVTIVDPTDNADVTAEPSSLTFTTANWDSAQTVTVSAVQDADMDDDTATVTHTVSGYGSVVTAASVTVTVTEDPTAPYDTDGDGAIDKSEASEALRDYLADGDSGPFGGTTSKEVASEVLRRYLERS